MKHCTRNTYTRGVTAIEVAIGVSIAALVLIFVTQAIALFVNGARQASERTRAVYLAEDGLELLRYVRDGAWNTIGALSSNQTYYLRVTATGVYIDTSPQTVDGYTRSFRVQNVYRNSSDDIVASTTSGASVDTSARYISMTVTGGNPTTTASITSILADLDP